MPTDGSCCYTPGLPTPTVQGPPVAVHNPCEMATPVFICNTPVLAPITVVGEDCAGAPLPVTGHDLIQTVPAPGAVQLVKFCNFMRTRRYQSTGSNSVGHHRATGHSTND
jgi:hypothetical protein